MDPDTLKKWRTEHSLTLAEFAPLLGTTAASISRWENGERAIPGYVPILLFLLSVKSTRKKVEQFVQKTLTL